MCVLFACEDAKDELLVFVSESCRSRVSVQTTWMWMLSVSQSLGVLQS